jgi:type IV pilus assembly protein PilQ
MPISLIFDDADLKSVLEAIADQEGFNLSVDPDVRGTVNTHFVSVPWDQALDQILRSNKLGYVVDGTIVRIAPITTLATESDDRRKLADAQANEGELHTLAKTLSYAKADELVPVLMKSNTLSPRGTVQTDPRTNTLIITDLEARITSATDLIAILDRPQPQVAIEARIVQTNKNFERRMGVQWGFNGLANQALGNTTPLAFPNTISLAGSAAPAVAGGVAPAAVNLAAPGATSAVSLALGSVNGAFNLDVALSALETSGNGRVLSTPRVTTQNNIEAEMTQGTQIPIQTVSNNTVTVGFKDAALTLKVTPQITAAGTVIMAISLENSVPDFSRSVNGIPPINTQRANTKLLVNDGETTVIGGVYTSTQQNVHDTTPGLSKIPILSWFFKRDQIDDSNTELLIFITPRILKE